MKLAIRKNHFGAIFCTKAFKSPKHGVIAKISRKRIEKENTNFRI